MSVLPAIMSEYCDEGLCHLYLSSLFSCKMNDDSMFSLWYHWKYRYFSESSKFHVILRVFVNHDIFKINTINLQVINTTALYFAACII